MPKEERVIEIKEHIDAVYGADCAYYNVDGFAIADELDNAGYRKASDVAKEIFEEIEKALSSMKYNANTPRKTVTVEELKEQVDWVLHEVVPNRIAEIKKKYESEGVY